MRRIYRRLFEKFTPLPSATGAWGERVAARHLRRQGLRILDKNFRVRSGEIDLIALDGGQLVFVEVKTYSKFSRCQGMDRIGFKKRQRIQRAALSYLRQLNFPVDGWRVDAVLIKYENKYRLWRKVNDLRWYQCIFDF